jgi:hypothetical protein
VEEPNGDEKSKRHCSSSQSEPQNREDSSSEDPTVSTSEPSSKIPLKRKRNTDPACEEDSQRSHDSPLSEDASVPEKQDKNFNSIDNSRNKV